MKNKFPAAKAVSSSSPPWIELPRDVTANILKRLGAREILKSAEKVCSSWWKVCQDPIMWRVIELCKCNPKHLDEEKDYTIMCRRAVERSKGDLVDLTIDVFADDQLINYIADRSKNLKRLTLASCSDISGMGLTKAVKKLPELEELHLTIMPEICAGDVEEIGISCPKLKSFSYNKRGSLPAGSKPAHPESLQDDDDDYYDDDHDDEDYILAISENMPNLRHLGLFAHHIQNDWLEIILDGCPNLESLDIRQCTGLNLGGDLGKRCHDHIKDLKLPSDSVSDIAWLGGRLSEWDCCSGLYYGCFGSRNYDCYEDYERYILVKFCKRYSYLDSNTCKIANMLSDMSLNLDMDTVWTSI
ncbi:hypothetical protein C2S51_005183 [Perilla frutescens var. frutescens]|nr:hypothetical protein C2S51_005183 [Perilla frutescens var. frutescens]